MKTVETRRFVPEVTTEMADSKFKVTLKDLRDAGISVTIYNRLVCSLQRRQPTEEEASRVTYLGFVHDEPIDMRLIFESSGLDAALWVLRYFPNTHRDTSLFAVWCVRRIQHLLTDPRLVSAITVAENFVNGEASSDDLTAAWVAVRTAVRLAERTSSIPGELAAARASTWAVLGAATSTDLMEARAYLERYAWDFAWDHAVEAVRFALETTAWKAAWDEVRSKEWPIPYAAAGGDTWSHAWDAAKNAATSAREAARREQEEMFLAMCRGEAPWQTSSTNVA